MTFQRYLLVICVSLVFSLGLVMIFDTSSADVLDRSLATSTHNALIRQILYALFGIVIAGVTHLIGYKMLLKVSFYLVFICTILLILVFVPGIGKIINGARRWVGIGMYTIQPSEFAKYFIPMFYIHIFLSKRGTPWSRKEYIFAALTVGIPTLLIFLEPDTGTTAILGALVLMLLFITKINLRYWALPFCILMLLGGVAAYNIPYIRGRIAVYLNPELDILGKGHQPYQAKIAAGSGGFVGKGIGKSIQKLSYLPEAQNDYIAAIYAEEFGFIGILILITLYMIIAYVGFDIAHHANDVAGMYLAVTITFLIALQAFLNLGVVSGLLPSTGLNLPFFSQGGTSLLSNIIGVGLLLNIADSPKDSQEIS
jgi:cell division protein FtsW